MLDKSNSFKAVVKTNYSFSFVFVSLHLIQGDKGYTIPEVFHLLREANLEFISMVNWRQWGLLDLFKQPNNLPALLELGLPETSVEERLHLYELLNPIHRLIDFWCGHPDQGKPYQPVSDWSDRDWQNARVYLHPQLKTARFEQQMNTCIRERRPLDIAQHLNIAATAFKGKPLYIDSSVLTACLLPLWSEPQPVTALAKRWQQVAPVDPISLSNITSEQALKEIQKKLAKLEAFMYVLLER